MNTLKKRQQIVKPSQLSSVAQFLCNSLRPHGLQHTRLPSSSTIPRNCSNLCPSSQWYCPTNSSSVVPFSSCLQSFQNQGISQRVSSLHQVALHSIGVSASASVLPMNIQDWFPLGLTGIISLQSKWFSRVFSNTTNQKDQFFSIQVSLWCSSHIHTWPLEKP